MTGLTILTLLAGSVIAALPPGGIAAGTDTPRPGSSVPPAVVSPAPSPGETFTPEPPGQESDTPLSRREDIILLSKFYRGMGNGNAPKGWKLDDKKAPIDISLVKEGDQIAVQLKSEDSAFGIYNTQEFDIREYPFVNWEWKVLDLPIDGSFLDKDKDDQAAQVYISFGSLSTFNKPFVKAVGYYWSSTLPVGTEGPCPTWGKSRVIVLQTGDEKRGQWVAQKRNVYDDYARLFEDKEPAKVSALRLYTNSQHTQTSSEALFRNIYFSKE